MEINYSELIRKYSQNIILTIKEEELFSFLLKVVEYFNLSTILRVAGGWVRDKILGIETNDIDIALDNCYGDEFAEYINNYLTSRTGIIVSNSTHLKTATMKILNISLDFVNLRCETYSENSRIPSINIGTPEEDAYRRDLTINSLFYNLNTKEIEDWTKMGLIDLKVGIIRTPMDPMITFLDDPLRVLRVIRFASKFLYKIDPLVINAVSSESVRTALMMKISRERIGKEIDNMLLYL